MNNQHKTQWKGMLLLGLTAFIWGTSFIAQSVGMEKIDAFTFNGIRTVMGALALAPVALIRHRKMTLKKAPAAGGASPAGGTPAAEGASPGALVAEGTSPAEGASATEGASEAGRASAADRKTLRYGLILGSVFFLASNFQQFAFYDSTAGKIAFITAFYMFLVPVLGLFTGKRIPPVVWGCLAAGLLGVYLLCIPGGETLVLNRGDLLALICAFFFAIHILLIERFTGEDGDAAAPVRTAENASAAEETVSGSAQNDSACDPVALSCIQFAFAGSLSLGMMFLTEKPVLNDILACALPLLYSGLMSCGIAYTLQMIGQQYTEATAASLIMCTESVFAVLSSALLLKERMTGRETAGCVLMFAAIIVSEVAQSKASVLEKTNIKA